MSYELKKDASGKFRFNLLAGNGQVILSSGAHADKAAAMAAIEATRARGASEANFEKKNSAKDEPYFALNGADGKSLGRSEMYSSVSSRDNGIASVQKNCASTKLKELT